MRAIEPVYITLADGKERRLLFTLGAMKRIKEKFGKSFLKDPKGAFENMDSENDLPEILLIGLVEKEDLTIEKLQDLIHAPMMIDLALAIGEAIFGKPKAQATTENPTQSQVIQ